LGTWNSERKKLLKEFVASGVEVFDCPVIPKEKRA